MSIDVIFFFFNDTATTEIYTLSLHDALPIYMREAPSRVLIECLLGAGASVRATDPEAIDEALLLYGGNGNFSVHAEQYDAVKGADALVLVTEWKHYWIPDFERLAASMRQKILVDGRNIWPQSAALRHGFTYHAIGRPSVHG